MPDYVQTVATDDAIRVVVLRGAGDQAFVAGADYLRSSRSVGRKHGPTRKSTAGSSETPVRASLGKLDEAAPRDDPRLLRSAAASASPSAATCASPRTTRAIGYPGGAPRLGYHYKGMEKLMKLVGRVHEGDLLHRPDRFQRPGRAAQWGWLNQVVPKAELESFNPQTTRSRLWPKNAPLTYCARPRPHVETALVRPDGDRDLAPLRREAHSRTAFNSQDYQEGVKAFSESAARNSKGPLSQRHAERAMPLPKRASRSTTPGTSSPSTPSGQNHPGRLGPQSRTAA